LICRLFFFQWYAKMFKNPQYVGEQLEKAYNQVYTDSFFELTFVDEQIQKSYQ
jgi:hypothetical protein